jgi:hypothetical protein
MLIAEGGAAGSGADGGAGPVTATAALGGAAATGDFGAVAQTSVALRCLVAAASSAKADAAVDAKPLLAAICTGVESEPLGTIFDPSAHRMHKVHDTIPLHRKCTERSTIQALPKLSMLSLSQPSSWRL